MLDTVGGASAAKNLSKSFESEVHQPYQPRYLEHARSLQEGEGQEE